MTLQAIARRLLGSLYDPLQRSWSGLRHRRRLAAEARQRDRVRRELTRDGIRILGGPFAGMHYLAEPAEGSVYPKLAGTYEQELAGIIETIVATPYDVIVDIGAAEGYYAVGLAMRMPRAVVHAYDVDPRAREACAELARRNGVAERVRVHGAFGGSSVPRGSSEFLGGIGAEPVNPAEEPEELRGTRGTAFGAQRLLVICDCEGCELQVLDPVLFAKADLLVELHDFLEPGVTPTVVARFAATHDIRLIDSRPGDTTAATVQRLRPSDRAFAVDEWRPAPMQWAWMTAKT